MSFDFTAAVCAVIDKFADRPDISPTAVATEVLIGLDPDQISLPDVYGGCHLHVRQVARGQLRKPPPKALPLFPDFPTLQPRYPAAHSEFAEEPIYRRSDQLSREDVDYNIRRMRAEIGTKNAHLNLFIAWAAKHLAYVSAE